MLSLDLIIVVMVVPLLILLATGVYIAVALGIVAFVGYFFLIGGGVPNTIGATAFNLTNNFVLTAIPLFIFMGEIILRAGFSSSLYKSISVWSQFVPGNLLHSNILACGVFSAISGSSIATAAAIGTIALPELDSRGYDRKLSSGSLAAGGTLGPLIPPSIALIIYGSITETSIGRLFMAGIIPGVLLAVMFMTYIGFRVKRNARLAPPADRDSWKTRLYSSLHVLPIILLILVVLGGIYFGVTTPTEAAAIGASGALILALAYRRLSWQILRESLRESVRATGFIMFIVIGAMLLAVVLANLQVPKRLAEGLLVADLPPLLILLVIFSMYFVVGMFFDALSMMLITLPVVFPIVIGIGYDPVWFGVALLLILEVGLLTPPLGLNLFVIHGIARDRPFSDVVKGSIPFFMIMLVLLAVITIWPNLVLWLPGQMISTG